MIGKLARATRNLAEAGPWEPPARSGGRRRATVGAQDNGIENDYHFHRHFSTSTFALDARHQRSRQAGRAPFVCRDARSLAKPTTVVGWLLVRASHWDRDSHWHSGPRSHSNLPLPFHHHSHKEQRINSDPFHSHSPWTRLERVARLKGRAPLAQGGRCPSRAIRLFARARLPKQNN